MRRPLRKAPRERGVAVITALLLTTLAIAIVASLFWQQQVQVRTMENQRLHLQTKWILRGALDWATLVLRQDGYDHPTMTTQDQVWATPLAETRLDQYIERERVEGEAYDATLSGNIMDACSRYNLRNLADHRQVDLEQQHVLQRLFQNLQIDPQLAERAAQFVAAGQTVDTVTPPGTGGGTGPGGAGTGTGESATPAGEFSGIAAPAPGGAPQTGTGTQQSTAISAAYGNPIKLLQVDDLLAVQGFTPAIVERLRPFLVVLPVRTTVNVNTAAAEVLSAIVDNLSVSEANSLVVRRKQAAWRDMSYFVAELNGRAITPNSANVMSEWFLVNSRIRLDRAALDAEALVYRPLGLQANGGTTVEWIRQY